MSGLPGMVHSTGLSEAMQADVAMLEQKCQSCTASVLQILTYRR